MFLYSFVYIHAYNLIVFFRERNRTLLNFFRANPKMSLFFMNTARATGETWCIEKKKTV